MYQSSLHFQLSPCLFITIYTIEGLRHKVYRHQRRPHAFGYRVKEDSSGFDDDKFVEQGHSRDVYDVFLFGSWNANMRLLRVNGGLGLNMEDPVPILLLSIAFWILSDM
jgi:hypothetical protein